LIHHQDTSLIKYSTINLKASSPHSRLALIAFFVYQGN